jgi:hypothetical protein
MSSFKYDETFWNCVKETQPQYTPGVKRTLPFFQELHAAFDHEPQLQREINETYERFFDEMDRYEKEQELETAARMCGMPKESIQEAMRLMNRDAIFVAGFYNSLATTRRQMEWEAATCRIWALRAERAQADRERHEQARAMEYRARLHAHFARNPYYAGNL